MTNVMDQEKFEFMVHANNERRSAALAVAVGLGWDASVRNVLAVASGTTHINLGLANAAGVAVEAANVGAQIAMGAVRIIAERAEPGE